MLVHPCSDCQIALTCDASDVAIGAVLEQFAHGRWEPLAFFSRQLRKPEIEYSIFDRELLGFYLATRHFRSMLKGRQFNVYTDHKPLVHAMSKATQLQSARQQRHLSAISEFSTDIRHISGKKNVVADCLSQAVIESEINAVSLGIDYPIFQPAELAPSFLQISDAPYLRLSTTFHIRGLRPPSGLFGKKNSYGMACGVKLAPGLKSVTNVNHQKFKNILVCPSKHLPCQKRDVRILISTSLARFLSPVVSDTSYPSLIATPGGQRRFLSQNLQP